MIKRLLTMFRNRDICISINPSVCIQTENPYADEIARQIKELRAQGRTEVVGKGDAVASCPTVFLGCPDKILSSNENSRSIEYSWPLPSLVLKHTPWPKDGD